MKPDRVNLNTRLPVKLHARLTKAARTNKRSLNAEMLARLQAKPETVERMLNRVEDEFCDQIHWVKGEMVRALAATLVGHIKQELDRVLRDLRTGGVPVLVNEELARVNREILRDEVRAAINDEKGKP